MECRMALLKAHQAKHHEGWKAWLRVLDAALRGAPDSRVKRLRETAENVFNPFVS